MNELGNTPADKNYKPSGISRAEEAALKRFPEEMTRLPYQDLIEAFGGKEYVDFNSMPRGYFQLGYEAAEKDFLEILKTYREKGLRCMLQSEEHNEPNYQKFWDGFQNCALNIKRELEEE